MTSEANEDARLTGYLLGQLREQEKALLEQEYLADPGLHERLRAVERDLIDRYIRGELPDSEAFERHYLTSPSRNAKVEFARGLAQWSDRSPKVRAADLDRRSWWSRHRSARRKWQVAATVAIVLLGAWFVLEQRGQAPANVAGTADGSGIVGRAPTTPVPPSPQAPPSGSVPSPAIATFVLMSNQARTGDAAPLLRLDANSAVRLQLELESGNYTSYRAVVRRAGGQDIWREDQLKSLRSTSELRIVVTIPAARFADDDYTIRVSGITAAGEVEELSGYAFRVQVRR